MFESTAKSYSEEQLIANIKEMYAVASAIAWATNQTQWLYQRLVDAALTLLTYDQHMLVMVGESFEHSWQRAPENKAVTNNRENYDAPEVERTHIRVIDVIFCKFRLCNLVQMYIRHGVERITKTRSLHVCL